MVCPLLTQPQPQQQGWRIFREAVAHWGGEHLQDFNVSGFQGKNLSTEEACQAKAVNVSIAFVPRQKAQYPFLKPHKGLAIGWLVFLGISSSASLLLPVAVRHIIDNGFLASNVATINGTFLGLFGVAVVLAIATAARYYCIALLGERSLASLRTSAVALHDPAPLPDRSDYEDVG